MGTARRVATSVVLASLAGMTAPVASASAAPVAATTSATVETTVTLDAANGGWFDQRGFRDATSDNYVVGNAPGLPNGRFRNFFVFDLAGISGTVVSARLSAANPSGHGTPSTYTVREVTTSPAVLAAGATDATAVYDDLGTGPTYGSVSVSDSGASPVVVDVNEGGIAAL